MSARLTGLAMASRPLLPRRLGARLTGALLFAATVVAVSSCGSRTGLFGPDGLGDGGRNEGGAFTDGPPPDANPCIPGKFTLEVATAQLMFVIDRSGSMAFSLAGDETPPPGVRTRWEVLRDGLRSVVLPFDAQIAMGAKFFPEPPPDGADSEEACRTDVGVGIPPQRGNVQKILDQFSATEPRGGTPTAEAVRLAAQFLTQQRGVARTIVLATDGAPNCNPDLDARSCVCTTPRFPCSANPGRGRYSCLDDRRSVDTIAEIAQQNIPVYVIGIGSTESPQFLQVLDRMAVAGGRPRATAPRHYSVQSASDMNAALEDIRDSVASCTYLTPSSPVDPNAISVELDGVDIPRDVTRQNGWDWVDQAYGTIAFFGDACKTAGSGSAQVSGVVSCDNP